MPLALIANELITNAFKHGCAAGATTILVVLADDVRAIRLTISDNGAGLTRSPKDKSGSLGLKMVNAMARQLKAKTSFPSAGMPASFAISVPKKPVWTP